MNEVSKTRIDLEVKDLKERKDTINKIMGEILKDMTKASRDKIEKYSVPVEDMEDEDETQTLEEARERGDWLFILEAARETHLMPGITDDPVLIYERQEQEKEVLSKLKHTYGDFNKWITLFENQITTCETVGVELYDQTGFETEPGLMRVILFYATSTVYDGQAKSPYFIFRQNFKLKSPRGC